MPRVILHILLGLVLGISPCLSIELRVRAAASPMGGADLSRGVVIVESREHLYPIAKDGRVIIPSALRGKATVLVPGYYPEEIDLESEGQRTVILQLQSFEGEAVLVDLGERASLVFLARNRAEDINQEAQRAGPIAPNTGPGGTDILGNPVPSGSMNPFALIEAIIGESVPEILGLDDD